MLKLKNSESCSYGFRTAWYGPTENAPPVYPDRMPGQARPARTTYRRPRTTAARRSRPARPGDRPTSCRASRRAAACDAITVAPSCRASSAVRSVEPSSTTMISRGFTGCDGEGAKQGGEVVLFVAGGDDDADARRECPARWREAQAAQAAQQEEARRPERQRDEQQDQHRSHATTLRATFWPQRTTIGMPPPGFTEPPTKKRFGYFVLCFGALKARFLKRSLTTP